MTSRTPYAQPRLFIGGRWLSGSASGHSDVFNPATGAVIGTVPHAGPAELDAAVSAAALGFAGWSKISADERAAILGKAARLIRERQEDSAQTLTLEQGKPLAEARAEIGGCAGAFDYAAEEGKRVLHQTLAERPGSKRMTVRKEPIGAIAAFSPWNFPAFLAARKVATALGAGCSVVIKPAEEAPCSFLSIAKALDDAGLPAGVLNVVFGDPAEVSQRLIAAPSIRKVAFTGSTRVGKELAALAGIHAKPLVMELGGHAPVLIF
ncbi:MAG: araE, partial [Gammaproteobacteria bacterium]|nr:araE [Gammaproteobacteria bacterium]